jgi:hypothetical protein
MKLFLKISFVACLVAGLFCAILAFPGAPVGENLAYYIGWWFGATLAGFFMLGVPICAVAGILIWIHHLFEKREKRAEQ